MTRNTQNIILIFMSSALPENIIRYSSTASWRTIGDKKHYFRSTWEANYARFLEFLRENNAIHDWFYEPETFWFKNIKRGVVSYKPDFKVIRKNTTHYWVEVKGFMDSKSKTKIKRLKKYYPDEEIVVVDKKWFRKNMSKIRGLCDGVE